jgi:hypothetical protein
MATFIGQALGYFILGLKVLLILIVANAVIYIGFFIEGTYYQIVTTCPISVMEW